MRTILNFLSVCWVCCLLTQTVNGQTTYELEIDSIVGIPDTIENGQEVTFFMIVSLNTPLFYQGGMFVELEYGGNFYQVDNTLAQLNFIGPNSPNTLQLTHRFSTDDDLSIGDNVVVVWPRIGDGTTPPQEVVNPETVVVTLIEPSGIAERRENVRRTLFHPNPAQGSIRFIDQSWSEMERLEIFDSFGHAVMVSGPVSQLDVSELPAGIYSVVLHSRSGTVFTDRLLVLR